MSSGNNYYTPGVWGSEIKRQSKIKALEDRVDKLDKEVEKLKEEIKEAYYKGLREGYAQGGEFPTNKQGLSDL